MSWKYVFNSDGLFGKTLEEICNIAESSGYRFFTFNGLVYFVSKGIAADTGISVSELF